MVGRWQIHTALVLKKLPEIVPKPDPIFSKVQDIMYKYEVGKSKLSSHEMQHLDETRERPESEKAELLIRETAQDKLDKWNKEKSEFIFADHQERLTYTQYMFVKQTLEPTDNKERWMLPQIAFDSKLDTTLLDTARRAMKQLLNVDTGYRVIGKIPMSCYSFNHPKKLVNEIGYRGSKVFFLHAVLDQPDKKVQKAIDETQNDKLRWLTINEADKFVEVHYVKGLKSGLLDEKPIDINLVLQRASTFAKTLSSKTKAAINS